MGLYLAPLWHDNSKFSPTELKAYATKFFGNPEVVTDENRYQFDYAWLHHQKKNKHHWQYWVVKISPQGCTALPIPERYLKEMICDWIAAGKAYAGKDNLIEWYKSERKNMILHPSTLEYLEAFMFHREAERDGMTLGG